MTAEAFLSSYELHEDTRDSRSAKGTLHFGSPIAETETIVVRSGSKLIRASFCRPAPEWAQSALTRCLELMDLCEDWDSYGAPPIREHAVEVGLQVLGSLNSQVPEPQIFPTPEGGLQLEWQKAAGNLEIEILPNGSLYVTLLDHVAGKEIDEEVKGASEFESRLAQRVTSFLSPTEVNLLP